LDEAHCDYLGPVHKSQGPFSDFETIIPSTKHARVLDEQRAWDALKEESKSHAEQQQQLVAATPTPWVGAGFLKITPDPAMRGKAAML
jgi:hypothetical protein